MSMILSSLLALLRTLVIGQFLKYAFKILYWQLETNLWFAIAIINPLYYCVCGGGVGIGKPPCSHPIALIVHTLRYLRQLSYLRPS